MQGFKLVKGSEPSAVYWRRRAIVAGAAVGLVLVVVVGLKMIGGGSSTAQGEAEPQEWVAPSASSTLQRPQVGGSPPGESPSPEESPSEEVVPECAEEELMLQVVAAFEEARSGSEVPVSVLVASGADEPCTVGMERVEVELSAGDDVVYSTAHCEQAEARDVELAEGRGETAEFKLDGRASEAGCSGERRDLPAGDYDLRARLGEAESQPTSLRFN